MYLTISHFVGNHATMNILGSMRVTLTTSIVSCYLVKRLAGFSGFMALTFLLWTAFSIKMQTLSSMPLCNILKLKGTIFVVDVELIILIWPLHYHLKRLWPKLPTCVCWLLPFFPLLPNIWPLSICSKASIFSPLKKYTYVIC